MATKSTNCFCARGSGLFIDYWLIAGRPQPKRDGVGESQEAAARGKCEEHQCGCAPARPLILDPNLLSSVVNVRVQSSISFLLTLFPDQVRFNHLVLMLKL